LLTTSRRRAQLANAFRQSRTAGECYSDIGNAGSTRFLAADFDKASWADDVAAFAETCRMHGLPVAVER